MMRIKEYCHRNHAVLHGDFNCFVWRMCYIFPPWLPASSLCLSLVCLQAHVGAPTSLDLQHEVPAACFGNSVKGAVFSPLHEKGTIFRPHGAYTNADSFQGLFSQGDGNTTDGGIAADILFSSHRPLRVWHLRFPSTALNKGQFTPTWRAVIAVAPCMPRDLPTRQIEDIRFTFSEHLSGHERVNAREPFPKGDVTVPVFPLCLYRMRRPAGKSEGCLPEQVAWLPFSAPRPHDHRKGGAHPSRGFRIETPQTPVRSKL